MNIVWITRSDLVDRTNGADLYSHGLLTGLQSCGVKGHVFGYTRRSEELSVAGPMIQRLFPLPDRVRALSLLTTLQSDAYRIRSVELAKAAVAAIDHRTDAVVIDYFAMGWILPFLRRSLSSLGTRRPTLVYVAHNHEGTMRRRISRQYSGNPAMKAVLQWDAQKARSLEQKLIGAADMVTGITNEDAELFQKDAGGKTVVTLLPAYGGPIDADKTLSPTRKKRVVMMGSLDWIAKRESLRRFADAANFPFQSANIELAIVGKVDSEFAQSIRSRSPICNFLGFLEDPTPILMDSRIGLMADELGGGFKMKYLDYIFRGLPVATIRSQAVGLPFSPEQAMILGDNVDELAVRIVESIDDFESLNAKKQLAYDSCKDKFDWPSRGAALLNAIAESRRATH